MEYSFNSSGHENILSAHKTTIEFTKDKDLTSNGDCIVGVNSDFDFLKIKKFIGFSIKNKIKKIKITINADGLKDCIVCDLNEKFSDNREIVIRKSDFLSDRTFAINANKAAVDLNKNLIKKIKNKDQKIKVTVTPLNTKCFIFDFDDTLEQFGDARDYSHRKIGEYVLKKYKIKNFSDVLDGINSGFTSRAFKEKNIKLYDRRLWFKAAFDKLRIKTKSSEINKLNKLYWKFIIQKIKPMPDAINVLKALKNKKYKLAIVTDPDETKLQRIKKVGIYGFFDMIVTGKEVNTTKPDRKFYTYLFKKLKLKSEECVMVGDRPAFDLEPAKKLGLVTIWLDTGGEGNQQRPSYADYKIRDLKELLILFAKN